MNQWIDVVVVPPMVDVVLAGARPLAYRVNARAARGVCFDGATVGDGVIVGERKGAPVEIPFTSVREV